MKLCFVSAGSSYMPLGHMLTFRVAYQIAAGLVYLHRKSIIFCDLKSDNILVWSLEVCKDFFYYFTPTNLYQDRDKHSNIIHNIQACCFYHSFQLVHFFFQDQDAVNIKLSDYGISRQSFHEGVLGVEGTPGYQAPEVRPGIVYDEKVLTASS